ncbi:HAMP domain-containing methyl-accepting chemotaxis protein [Halobacteriovorax marinus]|nr:methyl-accepting chemotaxis protein [Halobacteriovorax marinus]
MKKINFKIKLLLLCSFMSLVSLVIGAVSYFGFDHFSELASEVNHDVIPRSTLVHTMDVNYQKTRIAVRTLGLSNLSEEDREQAIADSLTAVANYENAAKDLDTRITKPIERELFNNVASEWADFKKVGVRAIELAKVYDEAAKKDLLEIFLVHCPKAAKSYQAVLDEYTKNIEEEVLSSSEDISRTTHFLNYLLIGISLSGICIGLIAGIVFANKISTSIRATVESLTESSTFLTNSANSIAETSQNLSSSSEQQDSSLQESSASLEEISSMVRMTADNAMKSNDLANRSLERASRGKQVVTTMIHSMNNINTDIDTIVDELDGNNEKMKHITELINKIEEKTQIINDIVFQTKLLSFNASVEAARAGEAGKGFAVVAEEVGNLAQLSGKASVDIAEMVSNSVEQVNHIIEDSRGRVSSLVSNVRTSVNNGSSIANECGEILESIVVSVADVTSAISDISTASQEQSKGIEELQESILQVDSSSKSNTGIAKDASEIAVKLKGQVVTVNSSIIEIQNVIFGNFENKKKAA